MTYSQFDPEAQCRVPWNFGAKIGPKRPFNQKQIWAIRFFLDREKRIRDRALFACHNALIAFLVLQMFSVVCQMSGGPS